MKKIPYIWIVLGLIAILAGCSPIRKMKTDVLEPAEMVFPDEVFTVGYVVPSPLMQVNTRTGSPQPNVDATQQFWTGLMDVAVNSPRFNPRSLKLLDTSGVTTSSDTLSRAQVRHISDSLGLDAVALVHPFILSDSLEREIMYDYGSASFYFIYQVQAKIHWKLYHPGKQKIVNQSQYDEEFVWESVGATERDAIHRLIGLNRAFRLSAYWAGYDMGQIMFPFWEEQTRTYYARGSRNFREARDYVEQNQWQKAIDLWKKSFTRPNKELARRAAYNIGFALEMMGKIDQAIRWINRAQEIQYHKKAAEYLEILRERQEKLQQLDRQMPI